MTAPGLFNSHYDAGRARSISMDELLGKSGKLASHIRKLLSSAAYRYECRSFVCEGSKLLEDAVQSGVKVSHVGHTRRAALPPLPESVQIRLATDELMKSLSTQKTPQGVLFICGMPEEPVRIPDGFLLVLDGVQDPGNVGTILRSAEAFGADCVLLTEGCADPYLYKTVRASMGSVFRQPFMAVSRGELAAKKAREEIVLVVADSLAERTVEDIPDTACVVIGSEGGGVSRELKDAATFSVKIPMAGRCESLNAAAAASVILWEHSRMRRQPT
jgi:TrmH family RNA methyltransferase